MELEKCSINDVVKRGLFCEGLAVIVLDLC